MKKLATICLALALGSCASSQPVQYRVTSTPSGALIEINGVQHGKTPTVITLHTNKKWVGVANTATGWDYSKDRFLVTATDPQNPANVQEKELVPHLSLAGGSVHFDLTK